MISFVDTVQQHLDVIKDLLPERQKLDRAGLLLASALGSGNKILLCGNGGSAADCQHAAAELMVRYRITGHPLAALALTTDTSILTAHSNDFGYDTVFARQVQGLGTAGDVLVAISTSGNSRNILEAVEAARRKKISTIGLTGATGNNLARAVDIGVVVPSTITARIQEAHMLILHWWCQLMEEKQR